MNNVVLIGRLVRDPDIGYTQQTQTACCKMTIAVDRPKRNGEDQGADFIRVIVWGKMGEACDRYLSKGRQVAVQGRITTGSYKNKNGDTVYTTDVTASQIQFIGSNNNNNNQQQKQEPQYSDCPSGAQQMDMSDIPDTFQMAEDDVPF